MYNISWICNPHSNLSGNINFKNNKSSINNEILQRIDESGYLVKSTSRSMPRGALKYEFMLKNTGTNEKFIQNLSRLIDSINYEPLILYVEINNDREYEALEYLKEILISKLKTILLCDITSIYTFFSLKQCTSETLNNIENKQKELLIETKFTNTRYVRLLPRSNSDYIYMNKQYINKLQDYFSIEKLNEYKNYRFISDNKLTEYAISIYDKNHPTDNISSDIIKKEDMYLALDPWINYVWKNYTRDRISEEIVPNTTTYRNTNIQDIIRNSIFNFSQKVCIYSSKSDNNKIKSELYKEINKMWNGSVISYNNSSSKKTIFKILVDNISLNEQTLYDNMYENILLGEILLVTLTGVWMSEYLNLFRSKYPLRKEIIENKSEETDAENREVYYLKILTYIAISSYLDMINDTEQYYMLKYISSIKINDDYSITCCIHNISSFNIYLDYIYSRLDNLFNLTFWSLSTIEELVLARYYIQENIKDTSFIGFVLKDNQIKNKIEYIIGFETDDVLSYDNRFSALNITNENNLINTLDMLQKYYMKSCGSSDVKSLNNIQEYINNISIDNNIIYCLTKNMNNKERENIEFSSVTPRDKLLKLNGLLGYYDFGPFEGLFSSNVYIATDNMKDNLRISVLNYYINNILIPNNIDLTKKKDKELILNILSNSEDSASNLKIVLNNYNYVLSNKYKPVLLSLVLNNKYILEEYNNIKNKINNMWINGHFLSDWSLSYLNLYEKLSIHPLNINLNKSYITNNIEKSQSIMQSI